jgi:hypothetical protein
MLQEINNIYMTKYRANKISYVQKINNNWYFLSNEKIGEERHQFLHRIDGPAIDEPYGRKEWYYEGTKINCASQEEFERWIKLKVFW